ncbi:MAG: thiamine phosphate synthase [Succinivibrio sp.]|nr:thiamine phosphate synthase [Succinivibrio sp.]
MIEHIRPQVLLVAGLDSGGGAGITADTISVHDNFAFALPAVTALTAQSLKSITKVTPTDEDTFRETLRLVCQDFNNIRAIKVGLISDDRLLEILLEYLDTSLKDIPLVWDPVLCGTAGDLHSVDLKKYLERILPHVTIFTPNLPEAMTLASWDREMLEKQGVTELGQYFLKQGAKTVVIKGGHNISTLDAEDTFVSEKRTFKLRTRRIKGEGAHGGGCALSSSLAALLACGFAPHDAAVLAKAYIYKGINSPAIPDNENRPPIGHHGFIDDLSCYPEVTESHFPEKSAAFPACPEKLGLYPVVDSFAWVKRLVDLGVRTIQLRIKDKDRPNLEEEIFKSADYCREKHARLFIDDYYELAIKAHSYGVHLGMEDLLTADLKAIHASGLRLGVSTHGPFELIKAIQLNPSYIALGHIFETRSKVMESKPQGVFKLTLEQQLVKNRFPTVAIGGIKLANVKEVLSSGAGSVALITGITQAEDPDADTLKWLSLCGSGGDEE